MTEWEKYERMISLRSEKVELGSIKEINDFLKYTDGMDKDAENAVQRLDQAMKTAIEAYRLVLKHRNVIYNLVMSDVPAVLSDFDKKAKDLGVDPNNVKEVQQLKKRVQEGKDLIKALDQYKEPTY